jgi:acetyl-CoA C-acetyltransferase
VLKNLASSAWVSFESIWRMKIMQAKIGIIGSGLVQFQGEVSLGSDEVVSHVSRSALKMAGITSQNLDAVVISSVDAYDGITISNGLMAPAAGGYEKDTTRIGGGGVAAIISACASILSESAEIVLVAGADAVVYDDPAVSNASYDPFFRRPVGLFNIPSYALMSTALLKEGITERDFALVAAKNYHRAAQNPFAHRKADYSVDDILSSIMIFWPLRALEIGPISKGGAALVLASERKTKELTDTPPVWIAGIGAGSNQYYGGWSDLLEMKALKHSCQKAYKMAGITNPASEIDVVELFNPFAPYEFLAYEALGLFRRNEILELMRNGKISPEDNKPVNPSGGALGTNPPNCGGIFRTIQAAEYLKKNDHARRAVVQDSDINLGFFGETYHVLVIEEEVK